MFDEIATRPRGGKTHGKVAKKGEIFARLRKNGRPIFRILGVRPPQ